MVNVRQTVAIIVAFIVLSTGYTYAYEVPAHKALSEKIVREYMRKNPEPIRYLGEIRKGSADEDEHPWYRERRN